MSDAIESALLFLVNTLFDIYLFILALRVVLVWVRSDYFNPLTQFVVKVTDFIVKPIRRLLPNIMQLETASVFLILILEMIKYFLISLLTFGVPNWIGLPILACGDFLNSIVQIFTFAIIIQVILSFIQPMSPIMGVLYRITSPILNPLHRIIPTIGGFDITPIPALMLLQLAQILFVAPLVAFGRSAAFG